MGPSDACPIEVGKGPGPSGVRKGQDLAAWGLGCALSTLVLYRTAVHLRSSVVADLHRQDAHQRGFMLRPITHLTAPRTAGHGRAGAIDARLQRTGSATALALRARIGRRTPE